NKSKIKRIVVVGISSFGGSLFGVSGKPVDNETRINLTAFNRIFGVKCIINQWFNKLEQFLTVDLTNGNVKGRLIKSFERSKEKDKIARLLLRTDNMPVYGFRVPAYPVKEKLLPDKWVQTTLDSTPINSSNEFLFVGCKTEQHWGHIVIINYEQNVICNEEFKFDGAPPSDYIRRAAQEAAARVNASVGTSGVQRAKDIIADINARFKDNPVHGNVSEADKTENTAEYSVEIEINDYPQKARWKVTNK
ncbi:16818_t:CDS:2, partial [Entrophospora sp. SA101]